MKFYNKLVRDKIPEILDSKKIEHTVSIVPEDMAGAMLYETYLHTKLLEELLELKNNPSIEEAADLFEVMLATFHLYGYNLNDVNIKAAEKRQQSGGFMKRIILRSVHED